MSELLDKQMNAQKESLKKYFRGSHKLPQANEKSVYIVSYACSYAYTYIVSAMAT